MTSRNQPLVWGSRISAEIAIFSTLLFPIGEVALSCQRRSLRLELNWYAMGTKLFDLIETISDLRSRIEEGRRKVKETQHISDSFQTAVANREKAFQRMSELQVTMASRVEPARNEAKAELDRQASERATLVAEADDLWRQLTEANGFLCPINDDLLLLLGRLPLTPEWEAYRQALERLNVRGRGSWTDPPENPALDTLEMRLQEMLDLATRTTPGKVRRLDPLPTPEDALWKDVSLTLVSEYRVQIAIRSVTQTRNYSEMGFEDRRGGGGKPDSVWACLTLLAKSAGRIERPVDFNRRGWPKIEKQVQAIRARFRALFRISGDPLPFRNSSHYEAEFKIKLGDSYQH
jgi:hypothetical protein